MSTLGERLRDEALDKLRAHRAELIGRCKAAALAVLLEVGEVTADDVRNRVHIPPDISPKLVGVAFRDLRDAGIIRPNGHRNSDRAAAHAREIRVWALVDKAAAKAELARLKQHTPPAAPRASRQRTLLDLI